METRDEKKYQLKNCEKGQNVNGQRYMVARDVKKNPKKF
jgi:hypothetical protein